MIPGWIQSLEDYRDWMDEVLACFGESVDPDQFYWDIGGLAVDSEGREIRIMAIPAHRITFWSLPGLVLDFELVVHEIQHEDGFVDIEHAKYSYHLSGDGVPIYWRYDMHPGHPELGPWHCHEGSDDNRVPSPDMDLQMVMDRVLSDFVDDDDDPHPDGDFATAC